LGEYRTIVQYNDHEIGGKIYDTIAAVGTHKRERPPSLAVSLAAYCLR